MLHEIKNLIEERAERSFNVIHSELTDKEGLKKIVNEYKNNKIIHNIFKIQALINVSTDLNQVMKQERRELSFDEYLKEFDFYYNKGYLEDESIKPEILNFYDRLNGMLKKEIDFLYDNA